MTVDGMCKRKLDATEQGRWDRFLHASRRTCFFFFFPTQLGPAGSQLAGVPRDVSVRHGTIGKLSSPRAISRTLPIQIDQRECCMGPPKVPSKVARHGPLRTAVESIDPDDCHKGFDTLYKLKKC